MKKLGLSLFVSTCVLFAALSSNVFAQDLDTKEATDDIGVTYRTHIENEGWLQGWISAGGLSGSEGKGLRLEGIEIELMGNVPDDLGIQYQTHIENNGWSQGWVSDGEMSGSQGQGLRLEAIEIKLTGASASDYTVRYRTHIQNNGWQQGWVEDGALSGSEGKGLRLEAIEIVIAETPVKIAYDEYQAVLAQAKEADYTIVTWAAYQKVVDANVVTKEDLANAITEATTAIQKAQESLIKKADLSIYNEVLSDVTQADYTPATWTVYQAIVDANVVTAEDTQAKVDAATIAIIKAQKNLIKLTDLTAYEAALAAVTEDQVKSGWSTYKAVVDANVVTAANTQAEVDLATANILEAQKKLVLYSDLTAFNKAIELYVQYGNDAANAPYTSTTWNAYTAKCETYGNLTNGVWVYDVISKDSAQFTIDAATADISGSVALLVQTADLTEFNAAKNIKISDGPYTTASFTAYTNDSQVKAITSIPAETLKAYSQSVVDGYTNTLIALQNGILQLGSDLTAYTAALAAVSQANYTPTSWTAYQAVVTANGVTADSAQATVDTATANIVAAQKNLVYTAAYVVANAKLNSSNFGVQTVGDNILTRANELITAAGLDKTDYTLSFSQVGSGSAAINSTTGEITSVGSATVKFIVTPKDGSAAATTAEVSILVNP
ncbi:MAG: hypothetical protein ABGU93_04845 [Acetobacterium sp.]|uniref:hypothetical protein n=1 Tax=Acetobacterium sp. TaxID=1872094 RepID=UPI0032423619